MATNKIITDSDIQGGFQQVPNRQVIAQRDLSGLERAAGEAENLANRQMWEGIGQIHKSTIQGIQDYALNDLEEEQQQNVDAFVASRENARAGEEAFMQAAELQKAQDSLISKMGPAALPEDFAHLDEAYKREMDTYTRAKEQGIMSVAEFETKVLETTRRHVRRLPSMTDEFMAAANRVLKINGVYGIKEAKNKQDDQEAKELERRRTLLFSTGVKLGIPFDILNPDEAKLNQDIQKRMVEAQRHNILLEADKEGQIMDDSQRKQFLAQGGGTQFVNGNLLEFQTALNKISTEEPNYDKSKRLIAEAGTLLLNKASGWLRNQNLITSDEGKEMYASLKESVNNIIRSYDTFSSGEDALKFANNQLESLRNDQELGVRRKYDVATIDLFNKLGPDFITAWSLNKTENRETLFGIADNMITQALGSQPLQRGFSSYTLDGKVPDAAIVFSGVMSKGSDEDVVNAATTMRQLTNRKRGDSPVQALTYMDGQVRSLSDPRIMEQMKQRRLPGEAVSQFTHMIDDYLGQVFSFGNTLEAGNRDSIFGTGGVLSRATFGEDWVNVEGELLADGRILFSHPNKELESELNNKIGQRFNYAVQALATIGGTSVADAAKQMYDRYKDNFSSPQGNIRFNEFWDRMTPKEWDGKGSGKNPESSAAGHGQFVKKTFLDLVSKYRPDLDTGNKEEVLKLRYDKNITKELGEHLWRENREIMKRKDIPINGRNDYLAWFFGAPGAIKVIQSPHSAPIKDVIDEDSYNSNKPVFDKYKTVGEVLRWASRGM